MKEKVGRNSRETESTKNMTAGHRVEGQQETMTSLAASVPGCAHAALGEPHLPPGWSWGLSQQSALGDVGSAFTFPLEPSLFFKSVDVPANQR